MIPSAPDIEKTLLGSLMQDPQFYPEIQDLFHEELFYSQENKAVARAIITLRGLGKVVDLTSVAQQIREFGLHQLAPGAYLAELISKGNPAGFVQKTLILNQYYMRRKLILKSHEVINAAQLETCDPLELMADLEGSITEIAGRISVGKTYDAMDVYIELQDHVNKLETLGHDEIIGVETGFKQLNRFTSGWLKGDLIIIGGRPGMGKTSLGLNTAYAAATSGVKTLVFSLEMPRLQLMARMAAQVSGITVDKNLKFKMEPGERAIWNKETWKLGQMPMFFEDRRSDMNYIKRKARKFKREKNIGLILIDHLGFIGKGKGKSTNDLVGEITADLKDLAKELEIPIILLCQLNRESEKGNLDNRPQLKHLRDSGNIEQDADMVILVYRPEYYNIKEIEGGISTIGKAELIIAKNRNGGLDSVLVNFDGKCTNFYEDAQPSARLQPNENFLP